MPPSCNPKSDKNTMRFVFFVSFLSQLLIIVHHSAKTISILQELHAFIDLGEGQFVANVVVQIDCLNPTQRKQRLSIIVLYYVFLVQRCTTSLHVAVVNQTALELYVCVWMCGCVCESVELKVSFEFVTRSVKIWGKKEGFWSRTPSMYFSTRPGRSVLPLYPPNSPEVQVRPYRRVLGWNVTLSLSAASPRITATPPACNSSTLSISHDVLV